MAYMLVGPKTQIFNRRKSALEALEVQGEGVVLASDGHLVAFHETHFGFFQPGPTIDESEGDE